MCQTALISADDYNAQELITNSWLITVSDQVLVTVKYRQKEVITKIITVNTISHLQNAAHLLEVQE